MPAGVNNYFTRSLLGQRFFEYPIMEVGIWEGGGGGDEQEAQRVEGWDSVVGSAEVRVQRFFERCVVGLGMGRGVTHGRRNVVG